MVIHIFPKEKFTSNFKKYIDENFGTDNHMFFIYESCDYVELSIKNLENVVFVDSYASIFTKSEYYDQLLNARKIIIHFFVYSRNLNRSMSKIIHKTYPVFWGGDFYSDKKINFDKNLVLYIKRHVVKKLKYKMISKCKAVVNLISTEEKVFRKISGYKGRCLIAGYMGNTDIINKYKHSKKSVDPYKVIVGNSATSSNFHYEVLDIICKYKNENVQFIFPLSYGDDKYRNELINYAQDKLGDTFLPLIHFCEYEEYVKMLSECSVGIFNNNRQQALGNINIMVRSGCKLFIKRDTPMWEEFVEGEGRHYYDVSDIRNLDFKQFIGFDDSFAKYNEQCQLKRSNVEDMNNKWSIIFKE